MPSQPLLRGLVAAAFTPFRQDGSIDVDKMPRMIEHVLAQGAAGFYVCGSTGEGPLLSTAERQLVAETIVRTVNHRVPVVIQVGHNSLTDARALAAHAQQIGADAISATPPGYFKPDSVDNFIDCLIDITAGAPKLPFYLYHIPVISGVKFDMLEFLKAAEQRLPALRGVKFSDPNLHEMLACIEYGSGRYEILFGVDEMLLGGLAFGARGAVGSTYNFAAPLYRKVIGAFERGDMAEARRFQSLAAEMIRIILGNGGRGGLKAAMALVGADCGYSRLPTRTPTAEQRERMRAQLQAIGFFEWTAVR
jgi:N-acetylneuraminate lyase